MSHRLGKQWSFMHFLILVGITLAMALSSVGIPPMTAQAQEPTAAQRLADMYAPTMFVQRHPEECSQEGEPYLPAPVEAVLGNPSVELRRIAQDGERDDPVIMNGPTAQDLAGLDDTYYLNFPGDPRNPGCDYERWFRDIVEERGIQPTVYARIATETDRPGQIALQYWHYWVFNDFNNNHESDWEMVQLTFDASTPEEALSTQPASLAFAQHGGGERAQWDDTKVEREDNRVSLYPAAGSHATYYQSSLWIGWGDNGTGFGCDDARIPVDEVRPAVVLIPDTIDPNGPFAWLAYDGRWGQRETWEFNGPRGLNQGSKWENPISWTDDLRVASLAVPGLSTIGPGSTGFFCTLSGTVSDFVAIFPEWPEGTTSIGLIIVALLVFVIFLSRRYVAQGTRMYARHWRIYLGISALMFLVAAIGNGLDNTVRLLTDTSNVAGSSRGASPFIGTSFGIGLQNFQHILVFALIVPIIAFVTFVLHTGDRVTLRSAIATVLRRFWTALGAVLLTFFFTGLLFATVILIPLALYKAVQWLYVPHAVMIDKASWREARHVSRRAVKGHWWRSLSLGAAIAIFSGVPGPLIGVLGLVLLDVPMIVANIISTLIYVVVYPIAAIAATLYYLKIREAAGPAESAVSQRDVTVLEGPEPTPAPA